jgi:hypothetical protein
MVARCSMSVAMLCARSSGSSAPSASLSSRRFFTVCLRCQVALSQSSRLTPRYPGIRVQSGSTYSRRGGYGMGWPAFIGSRVSDMGTSAYINALCCLTLGG